MHASRWTVAPAPADAAALITGQAPTLQLGARDVDVLVALYQYHYLTARHLTALGLAPQLHAALARCRRLYRAGLVARQPVPRDLASRRSWEYAYALAPLGAAVLRHLETEDGPPPDWIPYYQRAALRNNLLHDLAVADLCTGILTYLGSRYTAVWLPAEAAVALLGGHGGRQSLSPDALLDLSGPDDLQRLVAIEYDQTLRPDRVIRRLAAYAAYFQARPWRSGYAGLTRPPILLWSVSATSDRGQYWAEPRAHVLAYGRRYPALYRRVWLVDPDGWRHGLFEATPLDPAGAPQPLHAVLESADSPY